MTDTENPNDRDEPRPESPSASAPPPLSPPPGMALKTPDERKEHLARAIANNLAQGNMRVETQSDYNAVLVQGHPINHVLHLILTLCTCGIWAIGWIVVAITQKEKRHMLAIDEYGNVNLERVA